MKLARFGRLYDATGRARAVPSWDNDLVVIFAPSFYPGTGAAGFSSNWGTILLTPVLGNSTYTLGSLSSSGWTPSITAN